MDISEEDRRKMTVVLTESGKSYLDEKYNFLLEYFDNISKYWVRTISRNSPNF